MGITFKAKTKQAVKNLKFALEQEPEITLDNGDRIKAEDQVITCACKECVEEISVKDLLKKMESDPKSVKAHIEIWSEYGRRP